jgi:hypothetical protein
MPHEEVARENRRLVMSSVGRYAQDFERVCERIRATREMAKAVGKELVSLRAWLERHDRKLGEP